MIRLPARISLLLALAVLAGCAARPPLLPMPQPQRGPSAPSGQVTPLPSGQPPQISRPSPTARQPAPLPPSRPQQISSPAVMSLLAKAESLAGAGRLQRAAAVLERALNIEPRNPFIYQRLAAVRLAQGQIRQAQALAYKSNSLAVNNPFIQADNWLLIAKARRMLGDRAGRRKAMAKVRQYRLQSAALQ